VIFEESARFRALNPEQRVHELGNSIRVYQSLRLLSGKAAGIDAFAEDEECCEWKALQNFAARHA